MYFIFVTVYHCRSRVKKHISKFDRARLSALTFCKQLRKLRFSESRERPDDGFLIDSLAMWSRDSPTRQLICDRKRKIK